MNNIPVIQVVDKSNSDDDFEIIQGSGSYFTANDLSTAESAGRIHYSTNWSSFEKTESSNESCVTKIQMEDSLLGTPLSRAPSLNRSISPIPFDIEGSHIIDSELVESDNDEDKDVEEAKNRIGLNVDGLTEEERDRKILEYIKRKNREKGLSVSDDDEEEEEVDTVNTAILMKEEDDDDSFEFVNEADIKKEIFDDELGSVHTAIEPIKQEITIKNEPISEEDKYMDNNKVLSLSGDTDCSTAKSFTTDDYSYETANSCSIENQSNNWKSDEDSLISTESSNVNQLCINNEAGISAMDELTINSAEDSTEKTTESSTNESCDCSTSVTTESTTECSSCSEETSEMSSDETTETSTDEDSSDTTMTSSSVSSSDSTLTSTSDESDDSSDETEDDDSGSDDSTTD